MNLALTPCAFKRLKVVHRLSRGYNGPSKEKHLRKLLLLVKKHSQEIGLLYHKKCRHYLIETGDLLVLCLEILLEERANIHKITHQCFDRYEKKLKALIAQNEKKS